MRSSVRRLDRISSRDAIVVIGLIAACTILSRPAQADPPCDEPGDPAYLERMEQIGAAIEASDFEAVLRHIEWAQQHFDYAVLEYGRARALHNLDRFALAEDAYNRFLRSFEGCPDPDMLIISARQYRSLAVQEQAALLETEPVESPVLSQPDTRPVNGAPTIVDQAPPADEGISPGWFVAGGGAGLIVAGVIHDLAKAHLLDDQRDAYDTGDVDEFNRLEEEISRARTIDFVLYGAGLVSLGVGVTMLLIDRGDDEPTDRSFAVDVSTDGVVVSYGALF